ncbi:MAG: diadenylate cyclase CdaA [Christensenellales bacterium]
MIDLFQSGFLQFGIRDAIDIIIVAYLIYKLLMLTRETRAMQVLKGAGVLLIAITLANWFKLTAISWLLNQAILAGSIALVVLFQPELRRALEQIGRGKFFKKHGSTQLRGIDMFIDELVTAMRNLSGRRVGALILIEERTGLADIVATGTRLEAIVSAALIENVFEPNTPLHDGAMIIRGTNIVAAGCFLPLSDNNTISRQLGTRHRAALGISEVSDCHAFVVSEETGVISVAHDGKLTRYLDEEQIREILASIYITQTRKMRLSNPFARRPKTDA